MKRKTTLFTLLLAFVLCFSLSACISEAEESSTPTPEKVYKIAVSGDTARALTVGDEDTIEWSVTCDGEKVSEQAVVTVNGSSVTAVAAETSAKITAVEPGNARVTIKLKDHSDVFVNVTYSVSKPSFFGLSNGSWVISENRASVEGGQSSILTREKGKVWMFSAELDITDYNSTETVAIGSFLNAGNNALWFGLRNSDGTADGRFSVYIRNFLDGWEKADYDSVVNGYTKYVGTENIKFVLIRDGLDYYYNIAGMFGKFTDNHDVETYAGFQTQNQKIAINNFALETDEETVKAAIANVYPEDGVGAISISGPATLVPQIVSGETGTMLQFTAMAYANGNEISGQQIEWSIEGTLGAGKASINNGLLTIAPMAEGKLTVKATLGDLSDEITFTVIKQEIVEENDMFIAKGGVELADNGVVFTPDYLGSAIISKENESTFNSSYTYGAAFKQKVIGNFSIEFTVSDYVTKSQTPKLMFSLGSNANNFFVVYGAQVRIEAFACRNNNGFLQGNWFQGDDMRDLVNVGGATRYKLAVEGGMYAVYVKIGNDWQKLNIKQDGNSYGMVRSYEDFTNEREIVIGANALSCKISDVVLNNGSANDAYDYIQYGMLTYSAEYDFESENEFSVGFQATDWEGKNGSTIAKRVELLPSTFTLSYKLNFATAMTDAKFALLIGNTGFIINNKLSGSEKELSATRIHGEDWGGSITKSVAKANDELLITITRNANGIVRFYVNDLLISEDAISANDLSMYTFCPSGTPNEVTNKGCKAVITEFTVAQYAELNTWKVSAEDIDELKINAEKDVTVVVKHDGVAVSEGYTLQLVSANEAIVKIADGKVKGIAAGQTTVTINVMAGDAVVATTVIDVTVPEINYTLGFKGIEGDTVTIKKYDSVQLVPFVTVDIEGYTPAYTVTLSTTDYVTMSDSYLITAGNAEGETVVTLAVIGTELKKSITIVVSAEVMHHYVLNAAFDATEVFAGDNANVTASLSDNGQSVTDAIFEFDSENTDILRISNGVVTTVESAVISDVTVKVMVRAIVGDIEVATKEIEILVKKTNYELTVNGDTEIRLEYGKDTATVTFAATRNGQNIADPVVNVELPENRILEYANGVLTAKKGGNGVVTFVLGNGLASKNVEYTVIASVFSNTRRRGTVEISDDETSVKLTGGSGVAAVYPAKIWKIGGIVKYNEFGDKSGADVVGFTSGKDRGDTFDATLILGITSGDVQGMRYIEWYKGWGNDQKWINIDDFSKMDMSTVYSATNNKYWEFIRIENDYYFTYGDFYGKFTVECDDATFPGIFNQFDCGFAVSNLAVDYNEQNVRDTVAEYKTRAPYAISVEGGNQHTVGTSQSYTVKVIPAVCEAKVTLAIDTSTLTAGTATLENATLTLSADANGTYTVIATCGDLTSSITVSTTGERIFTQNDNFTAYGGVNMKDDGSGYRIVFADASKDGVVDECSYVDNTTYTAKYNKTVIGDFTVEFTVSNYVRNGFSKLGLLVEGGRTQLYLAGNDDGYRIETYSMCQWLDGGFSGDGTWASTDYISGFDPAVAHNYKIACVNGRFHLYVDGTEYIIKTGNGSLTYAARKYEDWTAERHMRFATKNCSAEISNIRVTKSDESVKYFGFYGYGDTYNKETDTLTLTMYNQGWNIPFTTALMDQSDVSKTIAFDLKFNDAMSDAKLGFVIAGSQTFWIENKLNNGNIIHISGNGSNEWHDTNWSIDKNLTIHFILTFQKNSDGKYDLTLSVQAEGQTAAVELTGGTRDNCSLAFKVFNNTEADMTKTVSISNLTVTEL